MLKKEEKNLGMILKFVEKKFVETTLEGNLHFSPVSYFSNTDAKYVDSNVGDVFDKNEGQDKHVLKTEKAIIFLANSKQVISFPLKRTTLSFKVKDKFEICSFMGLNLERDFKLVSVSNSSSKEYSLKPNEYVRIYQLNPGVIEEIEQFKEIEEENKGEECELLLFSGEIICKKIPQKYELDCLTVHYHDFHKAEDPDEIPDNLNELKVLGEKDSKYKGQREIRLIKKGNKFENINFKELKNQIWRVSIDELRRWRFYLIFNR